MNISSKLQANVQIPAGADIKAPKRQTAQEAIDNVRLDGQQNIDHGTELKGQAAQLKAAAQAALDAANQKIAAGQEQTKAGVAEVLSGLKDEADGVTGLKTNIDAEKAADQKSADSLGSIQTGIGQAHDLNTQLGAGAAILGMGLKGEAVVVGDVKQNVDNLSAKTADASALSSKMSQDNTGLIASFDVEKLAGAYVSKNVADFATALNSYTTSSATLRDGLAESSAGFNLNQQGETAKLNANVQRNWAGTYENEAAENAKQAAGLAGQGSQQLGKGVNLLSAASNLLDQSEDSLAVSSLLAQVSSADQDAGTKLQALKSFAAEGTATIAQADSKAQESSDKAAEGKGYRELSDTDQRQAGEAFQKGKDLFKQADDAGKLAKKFLDQANSARDQAAAYDAQGDSLIAQGKTASDEGTAKQVAGQAGRDSAQAARDTAEKGLKDGFSAENASNKAQTAFLGDLGTTADALNQNIADRAPLLDNVSKDVKGLSDAHTAETVTVAAGQQVTASLQTNLDGRTAAAGDLDKSVSDRDTALANQSAALDQIAGGAQKLHEGGAKVQQGKFEQIVGQDQANNAQDKLTAANEQDAAGGIIVEKGQKYVAAADAAAAQINGDTKKA